MTYANQLRMLNKNVRNGLEWLQIRPGRSTVSSSTRASHWKFCRASCPSSTRRWKRWFNGWDCKRNVEARLTCMSTWMPALWIWFAVSSNHKPGGEEWCKDFALPFLSFTLFLSLSLSLCQFVNMGINSPHLLSIFFSFRNHLGNRDEYSEERKCGIPLRGQQVSSCLLQEFSPYLCPSLSSNKVIPRLIHYVSD